MLYIINRKDLLIQDAEQMYQVRFQIRICDLEQRYRKEAYRKPVIKAFAQAAYNWSSGCKGQAASLGIYILYSSIVLRSYEYSLVLSGKEFWLDDEPVEVS